MPEAAFVSALANLSIGVICVCALVYTTREFLKKLDNREASMRALEKEVRDTIMKQLSENTHLMTRIIDFIDRPELRR